MLKEQIGDGDDPEIKEFQCAQKEVEKSEGSADESEGSATNRKEPRLNKFAVAFLDAEGDNLNEKSDDETEIQSSSNIPSKCDKRKKRKKGKTKLLNYKTTGNEDELDKLVLQMNASSVSAETSLDKQQQFSEPNSLEALLKVDIRSLDPDAELRRLLGRTFGGEQQKGSRTQQRRQPQWGRLVKSRVDWPPPKQLGTYMEMEKECDDNGLRWYRFRHNELYQNQQQLFWLYQRQMDHEGILNEILVQNPYHFDSLLLLAEILTVQEDIQRARDAVERGIFACESVFHTSFQPLSPSHRLNYGWRENRAFFLLLHRHLLHQIQRRCFQTALQFAKMIFAKDPDNDPLGLLLLIDILALKSRSPDFLLAFYSHYRQKRRLDMLPNFLFSLPLAQLALANVESDTKMKSAKETEAEKCLEEALVRFPFVLSQILDRLQVQADSGVERNYYLNTLAFYREPDGSRLLTHIYVHHSVDELWRPQLPWLEQATHRILPRLSMRHGEMDEWAQKRKSCFVGLPPNVARHCILHGIRPSDPALTHLLDELVGSDSVTDPCPPKDTFQDYTPANLDELLQLHGIDAAGDTSRETAGGGNGLIGTFLRTLLPEREQDRLDSLLGSMRQRIGLDGGGNMPAERRDARDGERAENNEEQRQQNNNRRQ